MTNNPSPAPTLEDSEAQPPAASSSTGGRFWRPTGILAIVLLCNAAIQAVLISLSITPSLADPLFWLVAATAYGAVLITAALVAETALSAAAGSASLPKTLSSAKSRSGNFAPWFTGWAALILVGVLLDVWPAFIVIAATPFVALAAADGESNAVLRNFRAIAAAPWRYVIAIVVTLVSLLVLYLAATVTGLFVPGAWGSLFTMFFCGLIVSWLTLGWARIYRKSAVAN